MVAPVTLAPAAQKVSRDAGSRRGSLSHFRPPFTFSLEQQIGERILSQGRSADLAANDWAANSGVNSITINAVGTGLRPQSHLDFKRLGISREAALKLQSDIEAVWKEWTAEAHTRGELHFEDLQFLGLRGMLHAGELLHLPVMLRGQGRKIELSIQDVLPSRLCTPLDKITDTSIVDGVERNHYGAPEAYWLATPNNTFSRAMSGSWNFSSLTSDQFTRIPARIAHRPGCFHLFRHNDEEQVRGESILAPGMNLFRHLSDALDNELLAAVTQAAYAMTITTEPQITPPGYEEEDGDGEKRHYEEVRGGTVMYLNKGEHADTHESGRPSPNFAVFCEFVMRAMAASLGISYEVLAKDFSKTNYSSARAALLEAWRVYLLYRSWLTNHYCQPIWNMVIEEAWLSGLITLPSGAPDFYDARFLYTQALWIGPPRGYVDPVKEISATVTALENRLMTYSEALAERGRDFDETMDEREEEEERLARFATHPTKPSTYKEEKQEEQNAPV
ncbi:MAG: phage portal protein [Deltaproteobacteria bacterium]|jgi:lambda family phage portal protein|nr:phage portal protein [Deltaproteobacteria bacterium]